jgi:hypothetical protein
VVNDDSRYLPNYFSLRHRIWRTLGATGTIVYIAVWVATGTIFVPTRHGPLEFHKLAMVPAALAGLMLVAYLLTDVADHYDRRNNEYRYQAIKELTFYEFVLLPAAAGVVEVSQLANPS